jgi:hypothetical protein
MPPPFLSQQVMAMIIKDFPMDEANGRSPSFPYQIGRDGKREVTTSLFHLHFPRDYTVTAFSALRFIR